MSLKSTFLNRHQQNVLGINQRSKPIWMFALIVLIGILLRFYQIGAESYWIDEMYTVVEGQQSASQLLRSGRLDQPPAYYLPFRLWIQVFGTTELSTRSFSALAGIGSIVLIHFIGKELFSTEVGLLSAFLMAVSEFQIMYSQQARYYTFFELMTLLSFLFFILAYRYQQTFHFALYVVSSVLTIYSHAFGIFIVAAQNLYVLLQRKDFRNLMAAWLVCQVLILLAVVPYFFPLFMGNDVVQEAISNTAPAAPPSLWQPLNSVYRFFMPLRFDQNWATMFANYILAVAFLAGSASFYALLLGPPKWITSVQEWLRNLKEPGDKASQVLLVSCWLACPILLPFILSWVVVPIFNHRYNIGAAPAVYLLLAVGILGFRKVMPLIFALSAWLILIAPGLHYYYVTDINQQWREATEYVAKNSVMSKIIVFPPYADIDLKLKMTDWYVKDDVRGCGLDMQLADSAVWNQLLQCVTEQNRFWVITFSDDPMNHRIESFFMSDNQTQLRLLEERQFVEISVYLFELTER